MRFARAAIEVVKVRSAGACRAAPVAVRATRRESIASAGEMSRGEAELKPYIDSQEEGKCDAARVGVKCGVLRQREIPIEV